MNIFFLHNEPATCAQMHCDKHVVKMILEYSQLLSTAHHVANKEVHPSAASSITDQLLKPTHINHPCAIWVRKRIDNYVWLSSLLLELHKEYQLRHNRVHKLFDLAISLCTRYNIVTGKQIGRAHV